ncbi:MAG: hypothetical protein ACLQF0_11455 [Dissulfurispiraceae bacterium]
MRVAPGRKKALPVDMDESQLNRLRSYAWNYFAYHAEQRIKTFNFYIILVAVIIGGCGTALSNINKEYFRLLLSLLGFLLTIISVAFAFLDRRNKELVRNGEAALRYLDEFEELPSEGSAPHVLQLFSRDDHICSNKPKGLSIRAHISYSHVFRSIFLVFGVIGLIIGIACLIY